MPTEIVTAAELVELGAMPPDCFEPFFVQQTFRVWNRGKSRRRAHRILPRVRALRAERAQREVSIIGLIEDRVIAAHATLMMAVLQQSHAIREFITENRAAPNQRYEPVYISLNGIADAH